MASSRNNEERLIELATQRQLHKQELAGIYSQGKLFRCLDDVRAAKEPSTYWGNWIVKGSIVLLSGFGGISKTTFLYSLFTELMKEGGFLGIEGYKDIKVLYLDLESDASLIKARLNLLGRLETDHPNFYYCNLPNTTFKDLKPFVDKFITDRWLPHVLVTDPLSLAFPSHDENDNAEATKQMGYIRDCLRKWQTTVMLVSHSGKKDTYNIGHNRGASARANLADICWNFHSLGLEYEDKFIFDVPKNRWIHDGFFECIEKSEGEFRIVPFPEGYEAPKPATGSKTYQLQQSIKTVLLQPPIQAKDKSAILTELGLEIEDGSSEGVLFHRALTSLIQRGEAVKVDRGIYLGIRRN